jgi:hypothetical protein
VPKVPQEALDIIKKTGYPDFMEKSGNTYYSNKLLGKLFRRVHDVARTITELFADDLQGSML